MIYYKIMKILMIVYDQLDYIEQYIVIRNDNWFLLIQYMYSHVSVFI